MKYIELTQNRVTMVDDEDFTWLNALSWQVKPETPTRDIAYASHAYCLPETGRQVHQVSMQVMIYEKYFPNDTYQVVDHIDGDGLNNQKANLRGVTWTQNQWNRRVGKNNNTGVKGVVFRDKINRYEATICVGNGKRIYLGNFRTFNEAVRFRKEAEARYHGEFARKESSS